MTLELHAVADAVVAVAGPVPSWIDASEMPSRPRGWYWAAFPETWVFYSPERNAARCIDHGDTKWHELMSTRYWGPWTPPSDMTGAPGPTAAASA